MREKNILYSWKEIAEYLQCNKKTCSRWEKHLGLPILRFDARSKRSSVFAYKADLDQWLIQKKQVLEQNKMEGGQSKKIYGAAAGVAILTILALALISLRKSPSLFANVPTIAVAPFQYVDSSGYDQYLCEGITKEIIKNLSVTESLKIIPLPASFAAKNSPREITQMADEIKADYVLRGELKKENDQLCMFVEMSRGETGKIFWAKVFKEPVEKLTACLGDVARNIYEQLKIPKPLLPDQSVMDGLIQKFEAMDMFLKGNYILSHLEGDEKDPWKLYHQGSYYSNLGDEEANELAIKLFEQAIDTDARFAPAYLGLARCYTNYVNFNWHYDIGWLNKAEELANKAQALTPNLAEYFSLRIEICLIKQAYFEGDQSRQYSELAKEALVRYPYDAQLNSIVGYCHFMKYGKEGNEAEFKEALNFKEKAFWADPFSLKNIVYSELLMLKKEFDKALRVCSMINNNLPSPIVEFRLGEIYYFRGDLDKSEIIFKRFETPVGAKVCALHYLGMIEARRKNWEKALQIIKEIELLKPEKFVAFEDKLRLASIYAGLGQEKSARALLNSFYSDEKINKNRFVFKKYMEIDRNFENLRISSF